MSVLFYDSCVTWQITMKQERYRVCAVCGNRHGPTYGFQAMLERLGMSGWGPLRVASPSWSAFAKLNVGYVKQTLTTIRAGRQRGEEELLVLT